VIVTLALEGVGEASYSAMRCIQSAARTLNYPSAFTVEPCNVNEKLCFKQLLEELKSRGISFKIVVADAQYDSGRVREGVREHGAEAVIPYRKCSKIKNALRVGCEFVVPRS
jgi:hypothetical protein